MFEDGHQGKEEEMINVNIVFLLVKDSSCGVFAGTLLPNYHHQKQTANPGTSGTGERWTQHQDMGGRMKSVCITASTAEFLLFL